MSYAPPRPTTNLPSHLRNPSTAGTQSSSGSSQSQSQSPFLLARIQEKKAELASLKELQTLSAGLADQMAQLEEKLSTLSDGTEAVATVLGNWHNVLRAISMASAKLPQPKEGVGHEEVQEPPLPQTMVRIPAQVQDVVLSPHNGDGTVEE